MKYLAMIGVTALGCIWAELCCNYEWITYATTGLVCGYINHKIYISDKE